LALSKLLDPVSLISRPVIEWELESIENAAETVWIALREEPICASRKR